MGLAKPVQVMDGRVSQLETVDSDQIPAHLSDLFKRSRENLTRDQEAVLELLREYSGVLAAHELDEGCFEAIQHDNNRGCTSRQGSPGAHVPRFEHGEEKHLSAMLKAGQIQPFSSSWAASSVLVRERDGDVPWCLDYTKLSAVTKKDAFPLPLDCLDA